MFVFLIFVNSKSFSQNSDIEIRTEIYNAMADDVKAKRELIKILVEIREAKVASDNALTDVLEKEKTLSTLKEAHPEIFHQISKKMEKEAELGFPSLEK